VALSTTEAEYIAATEADKELLWLTRFLLELGMQQEEAVIFCDSQSAMDLSKNATYHSRTKHIDVRFHWLRDVIENQQMKLKKIHTDKNPSDMLTKIVPKDKLELCRLLVGMDTKWWLEDWCASLRGLEGEIVGVGPVMGPAQNSAIEKKKKKKALSLSLERRDADASDGKKGKRSFSCDRGQTKREKEREK
jgi:hypothetical protein